MIDLQNSDCLDYLRSLPDKSIDLVLIDPPYFIGYDGGKGWDSQWKTEDDYLDWCRQWMKEADRVLKDGRSIYVWGTTKTDTFLKFKLDVLNKIDGLHYQNWIIWSYDWGGRTKKTFARKHEDCLHYTKGRNFLFNADAVRIPYKMKKSMRAGKELNPLGKIPTDVWQKNNHTTSNEHCSWHPTQKPVELLKRIILAHTNEGDTVLDCFSGSGSTALAAKETGRKFRGCEADADYWRRSLDRLNDL